MVTSAPDQASDFSPFSYSSLRLSQKSVTPLWMQGRPTTDITFPSFFLTSCDFFVLVSFDSFSRPNFHLFLPLPLSLFLSLSPYFLLFPFN
jgi:hypothetical protein